MVRTPGHLEPTRVKLSVISLASTGSNANVIYRGRTFSSRGGSVSCSISRLVSEHHLNFEDSQRQIPLLKSFKFSYKVTSRVAISLYVAAHHEWGMFYHIPQSLQFHVFFPKKSPPHDTCKNPSFSCQSLPKKSSPVTSSRTLLVWGISCEDLVDRFYNTILSTNSLFHHIPEPLPISNFPPKVPTFFSSWNLHNASCCEVFLGMI